MKLHEKVRRFRELNQWSQENLAYELGLNQSQYSRRENGSIKFNSEEIILLARIFKISPSLLFGEEEKDSNSANAQVSKFAEKLSNELIQQYELRLKEKDELIAELREKIILLQKAKV